MSDGGRGRVFQPRALTDSPSNPGRDQSHDRFVIAPARDKALVFGLLEMVRAGQTVVGENHILRSHQSSPLGLLLAQQKTTVS